MIRLTAPLALQAATADDSAPTFTGVAYTGGPMRVQGFYGEVVVDMRGLALPSSCIGSA
jgi:hypothetical protein